MASTANDLKGQGWQKDRPGTEGSDDFQVLPE